LSGNHLWWCCAEHVKTMVVSLRVRDLANTWSFKKVSTNCSSRYLPILIKLYLNKLSKSTDWPPNFLWVKHKILEESRT
jgi:hypothetical protein